MVIDETKPKDVTCPVCDESYEFYLDDDGDWVVDTEWLFTPHVTFLESRPCWLKASGYLYNKKEGKWVN